MQSKKNSAENMAKAAQGLCLVRAGDGREMREDTISKRKMRKKRIEKNNEMFEKIATESKQPNEKRPLLIQSR